MIHNTSIYNIRERKIVTWS